MKKSVSKLLAVLMMLTLAVGLAACSSKSDSQFVGEWKATSASYQGQQVDMSTLGLSLSLSLKADGTVTVNGAGQTGTGKWEETANGITISDSTGSMSANYVNGKLELNEPSSGVIFHLEKQQ